MSRSAFTPLALPLAVTDTRPHPQFPRFTDANFSEVAPDRLSPLAWSVLGPPMERAFRDLYCAVAPSLRPMLATDRWVFVGSFGLKPYHSADALLAIVPFVAGVEAADVARLYLQQLDVEALVRPPRRRAERTVTGALAARRFATLADRLDRAEELVTEAEEAKATPLSPPIARLVGRALDAAWSGHVDATCFSALAISWSDRLGSSALGEDWRRYGRSMVDPPALPWTALFALPGQPSTEFLAHPFYEVGDEDPEWQRRVPSAAPQPATGPPVAPARPGAHDVDLLLDTLLAPVGPGHRRLLRAVAAQARHLLADRERAKSLAMRAQHCARVLARGAGAGTGGRGWSGSTFAELACGSPLGPRRLEAIDAALTLPLPRQVDVGRRPTGDEPAVVPGSRLALPSGVSPGVAVGRVAAAGAVVGDDRVLVVEHADAPLLQDISRSVAVVCERGSDLSHVAIICRSLGIPAVVNVEGACARFPVDTLVSVDAGAATVEVIAPERG